MAWSIGWAGYGEFLPRSHWGLESGIPLPRLRDRNGSWEGLFRSVIGPATRHTVHGPALPARVKIWLVAPGTGMGMGTESRRIGCL
jgi:hypothetical protein